MYHVAYNRDITQYLRGMTPVKPKHRAGARRVRVDIENPKLRGDLEAYFDAGVAPRPGHPNSLEWYDHTQEKLRELLHGDEHKANLVIDLLASTSPQTSIIENIYRALFWLTALEEHWLYELKEKFEAHFNNCCRSFLGLPLSGRKVTSFQANLLGNPNAVTVDTWLMRAFGLRQIKNYRESGAPSEAEYDAVSDAVREFAAIHGVQPCQMQAALWVGIKRVHGYEGDTSKPFEDIFRDAKAEIDSQLKLDFDGTMEVYAVEGAEKQHFRNEDLTTRSADDAPADSVESIPFGPKDELPDLEAIENLTVAANPRKRADPVYGGELAYERIYSVGVGDAWWEEEEPVTGKTKLVHTRSAIDPEVFDYIFFQLKDPEQQTMAFYYLREHTQIAIRQRHEITSQDVYEGMHSYRVLQPITLSA